MWTKLWSLLILRYDIWWDSVYYRIFPDTPECIFEGEGRASDSDLPPLLMPAVYNVRCTSYYDITLMPATLSSHWSEHPGPWLAGSGAWQWRVSIETFSSFRQPYPLSQSRQTKQQSIAKFLEKHNEFSTILLTKLCLMSVQGSCTAPTLWRPSLSHMLTCSTVCSNINR